MHGPASGFCLGIFVAETHVLVEAESNRIPAANF